MPCADEIGEFTVIWKETKQKHTGAQLLSISVNGSSGSCGWRLFSAFYEFLQSLFNAEKQAFVLLGDFTCISAINPVIQALYKVPCLRLNN